MELSHFYNKRVAIIVPHNDDEVIGCWYFLNKLVAHTQLKLFVVTTPETDRDLAKQRKYETQLALTKLNITDVEYWNIPDGLASKNRAQIERLVKLISDEFDFFLAPAPNDRTNDHIPIAEISTQIIKNERLLWYRSTWWTFKNKNADFIIYGGAKSKKKIFSLFKSQNHISLNRNIICSQILNFCRTGQLNSSEAFMFAQTNILEKKPLNTLSLTHILRLPFWI